MHSCNIIYFFRKVNFYSCLQLMYFKKKRDEDLFSEYAIQTNTYTPTRTTYAHALTIIRPTVCHVVVPCKIIVSIYFPQDI